VPGYEDWLADTALGAVLIADRADGEEWAAMFWNNPALSEHDKARLGEVGWFGPSRWGTPWPAMDRIVPAGKALNSREGMIRRNACLMLRAVLRRRRAGPGG
jgi:hypothetical protein